MKLLYDRILLRIIEPTKRTSGGLFMPDVALEGSPYRYGEVVAVGTGRVIASGEVRPLVVAPGDCVMFFRERGGEQLVIPWLGEDLLIAREVHVVMVIDKSELKRGTGLISIDGREVTIEGSA